MVELIKKIIQKFRRVITFGIVGVINTGVDWAMFMICHELVGIRPELSQALGYASGIICSFVLNRSFTFKDRSDAFWRQLIKFIAVNAVTMFVSAMLMGRLTSMGINPYISKAFVTGVVMIMNYFGYKLVVFRGGEDKGEAEK